MRTHSPRVLPVAALVCAALSLGACGSDDDADAEAIAADDQPAQGAIPTTGSGDGVPEGDAGSGTGDADPDTGSDDPVVPGGDDDDGDDDAGPVVTPVPGGGTDVEAGGDPSRFGFIGIEQSSDAGIEEASIFAGFFSFDRPLPIGELEAGFLPAADSCTVDEVDLGESVDTSGLPDLDDVGFAGLGAGDAIVITGPGGTYATLPRQDAFGFILYGTEDGTLPTPVPGGLVADIPGDEFPAFAAVPIPDVAPLTGASPANFSSVDADTTFRWDAVGDDARVDIELSFGATASLVSVTCSAVDDGEFALPAAVRAQLPEGQSALAVLSRSAVAASRSGDALLYVTNSASAR